MNDDRALGFEHLQIDGPLDETDISLRAYFTRFTDEKLDEYDPMWSDEQVIEWDGNFRSDGGLMLICCERDVDIFDYRQVLEKYIAYCQRTAS